MNKYHKIPCVFERELDGSKQLIFGKYINPDIESIKDTLWIFTEKVDGTNIRIIWDGYSVTFKGRTDDSKIPVPLMESLNKIFDSTAEQVFEQLFGEKKVILFGEGYGGNIQAAGPKYRKDFSFILFDVYFPDSDLFLERTNVHSIANSFGIDYVPIIMIDTLPNAINFVMTHPDSKIAEKPVEMEGLIGYPMYNFRYRSGNRIIVKIKYKDLKPFLGQKV